MKLWEKDQTRDKISDMREFEMQKLHEMAEILLTIKCFSTWNQIRVNGGNKFTRI